MNKNTSPPLPEPLSPEELHLRGYNDVPPGFISYDNGRCRGGLATWNGLWNLDNPELQQLAAVNDTEGVSKFLQSSPYYKSLGFRFWEAMQEACELMGFSAITVAIEQSTAADELGRVHLHCFMSSPAGGAKVQFSHGKWTHIKFEELTMNNFTCIGRAGEGRGVHLGL